MSTGTKTWRAAAVAFPVIITLVAGLFAASYVVTAVLGLPDSLGAPVEVRLFGVFVVLAGMAIGGWVLAYRSPANMVVSTYFTFSKIFGRRPISEMAGRTEPLVVSGPQRYTRNPLYFGVVVMVLGWALFTESTAVLVATVALLLWFGLFLIPFEERELLALFGDEWKAYAERTPMLIPFTKRRKPHAGPQSR